ncbi:MAG: LysR family transcriptional regulator [Gammaproteobacteria bacterium]|nr:LysR family transcriptional regulator [Gammaproteobacteria bacterium]
MDINTLRTLLEVNRTRHFGKAAGELFLTQSAVSARIKKLEDSLGVRLFDRQRRDIHPTPEGRRLLLHAESMLALWRKAQQDVALSEHAQVQLAVGGIVSLWDVRLQLWSHRVHRNIPELALILEAYGHDRLMRRMIDGVLDMVFLYEPPQLEEFMIDQVANISLIMVSGMPNQSVEQALTDYIMVDWGQMHALQHSRQFPDAPAPAQRISQGTIALNFMLACGGAAYLSEQSVTPLLDNGRLYRVEDAPVIERSAFAVYPRRSQRLELIKQVITYFDMA